ncbi:3-oxoacyl-ACP reductase [Microbacterium pumilum]|uniref:3-oxoacyl-ACP reductase n=1 Tax=Microbacterium pumilum TaxID=344165 RepID=A0ABN2RT86_9MICO
MVVTGASSGIGRQIVIVLAEAGARVMAVARREAALAELARTVRPPAPPLILVAADVVRPDGISALREAMEAEAFQPDLLVNVAGTFGPIALVGDVEPESWVEAVETNLLSVFRMCAEIVPRMRSQGRGIILNATSAASLDIQAGNSAYGTSKAAVNHFTRQLALELESSGVVADVFHPGDVRTEMFEDIRAAAAVAGDAGAGYRDWVALMDETGGDPLDEAAELVLRVAMSPDPPNGRFLWIDGGITAPRATW